MTKRSSFRGLALVVAAVVFVPVLSPLAGIRHRPAGASATIDVRDRASVIAAYEAEFHKWAVDPEWTGNVATCTPGTTSAAWRAATLSRVNYYRAMAGVQSVTFNDALAEKATYAAVMMSSKKALSHYPDTAWPCYTDIGAGAAASSNLSLASSGPTSADRYMIDAGNNNAAVGHRTWLLYPKLISIGSGDAFGEYDANAMWVESNYSLPDTSRDGARAWPSPGYFPDALVPERWSYHRSGASFADATVTVTGPNGAVTAEVEHREGFMGPGITFLPKISDSVTADTTYRVRIAGSGLPDGAVEYDVTLVDVNKAPRVRRVMSYTVPVCAPVGRSVAVLEPVDENPSTAGLSIVGGSDAGLFALGSDRVVKTAAELDPARLSYSLLVEVKDERGVTMRNDIVLDVQPVDSDTRCPVRNIRTVETKGEVLVEWDAPLGGLAVQEVEARASGEKGCRSKSATKCSFEASRNGSMELEIWVWHEGGVGSLSGSLKLDVTGVSTRTKTNTDTERPTKSPTTPTIRQGSVTQLKNLVKLPSGKRTYQLTGGCVLNARKTAIIAPKKKATCRLTVTGKAGKKTAKVKATLRVS